MNTNEKNYMLSWVWSAILMIVLIIVLALFPSKGYTLQYLEDSELVTESFKTKEEFNKRAEQLRADSIKYWLYLED